MWYDVLHLMVYDRNPTDKELQLWTLAYNTSTDSFHVTGPYRVRKLGLLSKGWFVNMERVDGQGRQGDYDRAFSVDRAPFFAVESSAQDEADRRNQAIAKRYM